MLETSQKLIEGFKLNFCHTSREISDSINVINKKLYQICGGLP